MLSQADILSLMEKRPRSKKAPQEARTTDSQGRYLIVRLSPGVIIKRPWTTGDHLLIGAYEGKVGTMKRSSKGRTSRQPNGSRKYIAPWVQEVVGYKA